MSLLNIYKPIKQELGEVEKNLHRALTTAEQPLSLLSDYILRVPGKRLRPALVLLSSKIGNARNKEAVNLAAAIELIHTATLVHDDIIDKAKIRRRQPSLNIKFGNDLSLLFGDYLYSRAFEIISALNTPAYTSTLLRVANIICRGEMQQLARVFKKISKEEYLKVIAGKTASLFEVCCELGGMAGGINGSRIKALKSYGRNLGISFQIADDCRDNSQTIPDAVESVKYYGRKASAAIANFKENEIKRSFAGLVSYVAARAN